MKRLFILLVLLFLPLYGETASKKNTSDTEAGYPSMKKKADFCCNREISNESAHDISEQESQKIVQSVLGESSPKSKPSDRPMGGTR